jgi:hypothetical protein
MHTVVFATRRDRIITPGGTEPVAARTRLYWTSARPVLKSTHPWLMKLWSFTRLAPGWNGSRAPRPSLQAILNAGRFIQAMHAAGADPSRLSPSAIGGVAVTRRVKERKVLVEFFNDGTANALFADDATEKMHTLGVPTTAAGYRNAIVKMGEYLDG